MSQEYAPMGLTYTTKNLVRDVNKRLLELGVDGAFKTSISFQKFNQRHEGAVTQSDFAVQFTAKDSTDLHGFSYNRITFFQAKIVNSNGGYYRSPAQEKRIEVIRSKVGNDGLKYCLYKPFEGYGIAIQDRHPVTKFDKDQKKWSAFMVDMLIKGYAEDELEGVSSDQQIWREMLIGNNAAANDALSKALAKKGGRWTLFEPAVMRFEIDFPAYAYRAAINHSNQVTTHSPAARFGQK